MVMYVRTNNDGIVTAAFPVMAEDTVAVSVDDDFDFDRMWKLSGGKLIEAQEEDPDRDRDQMLVDLDFRLTLLELGLL